MFVRTGQRAVLLLVLALVVSAGQATPQPIPAPLSTPAVIAGLTPAASVGRVFRNLDPKYHRASLWTRAQSVILGGTWLVGERRVAALPRAEVDVEALRANTSRATVTWVGHSTVLVQPDGVNFLTDPIWANRSGPFGGLVGVGRYTPPGIAFADLPRIDFVLISHDHYDHLDEPTVRRLAYAFNPRFVVPLGLKDWLADRGITNAVELNWVGAGRGTHGRVHAGATRLRPHAVRPGTTLVGILGGPRIQALLLRRRHRLLSALQADR